MKTFELILLYFKRIISFYFGDEMPDLKDVVHLEETLFHDLNGLFTKRLGLPISKFKAGNRAASIKQDIYDGAAEAVRLLVEAKQDVFRIAKPHPKVIRLYSDVYLLKKALNDELSLKTISILERLRQRSLDYCREEINSYHFEFGMLLDALISSHRSFIEKSGKKVTLSWINAENQRSFLAPYMDYSDWRRILDNFITNAVEAVEYTKKGGKVEIELIHTSRNMVKIRITDTGVGMDIDMLGRFTARGFTWGKPYGQGLGINEDVVAFIKTRGDFAVSSIPGMGTTVAIEIDASKIFDLRPRSRPFRSAFWRKVKALSILVIAILGIYILLSTHLAGLRFWEKPQIYAFKLVNPDRENPGHDFYGIKALDRDYETIWQQDFKSPCHIVNSDPIYFIRPIVSDIDRDGRNELIIPIRTNISNQRLASDSLICISDSKKEKWRLGLGLEHPRQMFDLDQDAAGFVVTKFLGVFDLPNPIMPVIVVCAYCFYYPSQVLLIDGNGRKLKEYWHAGHLDCFDKPWDMDGDGKTEFIFYGINNRMGWGPVVIQLEYDNFYGQSLPYVDSLFEPAKEDAYYLFGHAWIGDSAGFVRAESASIQTLSAINTVMIYGASYKPCSGSEYKYDFVSEDGRTIRFDKHFNLDTIIVDTALFTQWWESRKKRDNITRRWNQDDLKQLYGYRKYIRGELAVDSILINKEKYDFKNHWAQILH